MERLINGWYSEIDSDEKKVSSFGKKVVLMNFFASDDVQWCFIKRAAELARNAKHLSALAAGPLNHLLGFHGQKWMHHFKSECRSNVRFAYMMKRLLQDKKRGVGKQPAREMQP